MHQKETSNKAKKSETAKTKISGLNNRVRCNKNTKLTKKEQNTKAYSAPKSQQQELVKIGKPWRGKMILKVIVDIQDVYQPYLAVFECVSVWILAYQSKKELLQYFCWPPVTSCWVRCKMNHYSNHQQET